MNYVLHVYNIMWRIKNQPSNSTSCGDNALRLLVLVTCILYWRLQVTSSFPIWGCILKGCLERGIYWRAKSHLKGIDDFNLEHCHQRKVPTRIGYIQWPILLKMKLKVVPAHRSCSLVTHTSRCEHALSYHCLSFLMGGYKFKVNLSNFLCKFSSK